MSDYDCGKIKEFENSIQYKHDCYYIKLPWHEKIHLVPSNHEVALAVINKVKKNFEKHNLFEAYADVFKQQCFKVSPKEFGKYTWIPHRPVLKSEEHTTMKIRPVFNCSLNVRGQYSQYGLFILFLW